jgi:hypothetical protein
MNTIHTAGWFEDPTGRNLLRFWDGTQWTGHVQHHDGSSATDPTTLTVPAVPAEVVVSQFAVARGPMSSVGKLLPGGVAVAAVASFLPWVTVSGPFGVQTSATPSQGGVIAYILVALAATTWAAWPATTGSLSKKRCVGLTIAVAFVSLYAVGAFYGLHQVQTQIDALGEAPSFFGATDIAKIEPGLGLYIYTAAMLTLWVGVVRAWRTRRTMPVAGLFPAPDTTAVSFRP